MADEREKIGKLGETIAAELLRKKGLRIIARRFWTRLGEIDIIAQDSDTTLFVEVKARTSDEYGDPLHAVTQEKYEKMVRACSLYCQQFPQGARKLRIDVISVVLDENSHTAKVKHFQNITPAFDSSN